MTTPEHPTTNNKKILTLGLGPAIKSDPAALAMFGDPDKTNSRAIIAEQITLAAVQGYTISSITLDLDITGDWAGSLEKLRSKLQEEEWDAFTIGFGFRGLKHYTGKFEDVVNLARETRPEMKLGFPMGYEDLVGTALRLFGES